MTRKTRTTNQKKSTPRRASDSTQPFIEHVYELRHRLFWVMVSVGVVGALTYAVQQHVVNLLLRPAKGQQFIYTSPGGGIDFLFRICIYTGIAFSTPVIVYHLLRYLEPLIREDALRFIVIGSIASGVLAVAGIIFGYEIGLPKVLTFLLHQFVTQQIRPLVTIQSYMSFVMVYMVGSALLFQIPLVLIVLNRIKPLKPRNLFRYEKFVIGGSFIAAGLMNPTPNLLSQLVVAGPMIAMYQIGIGIIWVVNRRARRPKHVLKLLERDAEVQASRLAHDLQPLLKKSTTAPTAAITATAPTDNPYRRHLEQRPSPRPVQRRLYISDIRQPYRNVVQAE